MPRYTLHRSSDSPVQSNVPDALRKDSRVRVIGEMPQMLLIESSDEVAHEWAGRMAGWKLGVEKKARVPDTRKKLKRS